VDTISRAKKWPSSVCKKELFTGLLDFIPLFSQFFGKEWQRDIDPAGGIFISPSHGSGIPVFFRGIELNFSGCFRQIIEPSPCPLILRPDPELPEHTIREGKGPKGINIIREFFFNDAGITKGIPDFFQLHYTNRGRAVHQPIEW
jgi:hypothetical protein